MESIATSLDSEDVGIPKFTRPDWCVYLVDFDWLMETAHDDLMFEKITRVDF